MAWTTPKTWAADELLTASDLNQYVRDNLSALYDQVASGRRNLCHNGKFQVAQRGTSVASLTSTSAYATADRWMFSTSSLGTWTMSVENDAPTGSGFRKSLKMLCTTADASPSASDFACIIHRVEGQNLQDVKKGTADAEKLTLSFWTKSNLTGTYIVELEDSDNTRHCAKSYTVTASATWEQQTITFPADTTGAFDNDNAASLAMTFWLGSGTDRTSGTLATAWASVTQANRAVGQANLAASTNNYMQITGVQLEVGDTATPYEHKNFDQELRECQRYFYSGSGIGGACDSSALTRFYVVGSFPVTMRTDPTPTITEFRQYNGAALTISVQPAVNMYGYTSTYGTTSTSLTFGNQHKWTGTFSADL